MPVYHFLGRLFSLVICASAAFNNHLMLNVFDLAL